MQEDVAEAIRDAVRDIAIAMLNLPVRDGECSMLTFGAAIQPAAAEAAAIILVSGGLEGGIRLAAPRQVAAALAGALAGEPFAEFSGDARDAFGEICNMIAGGVQSGLANVAGEINLSPPVVVGPGESSPLGVGSFERVVYHFQADPGMFLVEAFYLS